MGAMTGKQGCIILSSTPGTHRPTTEYKLRNSISDYLFRVSVSPDCHGICEFVISFPRSMNDDFRKVRWNDAFSEVASTGLRRKLSGPVFEWNVDKLIESKGVLG